MVIDFVTYLCYTFTIRKGGKVMLRDMVQDGVLRFRVKMFNKLFPIGKHLYAMEVYPMLKVIYNGVRSDDIFDAYVSEVKKHYREYPEKVSREMKIKL